ncbi:MAG TPA: ring-hydroxylating oxygenase subunit alpha [Planctomycetaceae bacterium]|nr:ring-hydroxylating oxygenase subunit alpha [Planctomycetaceae bacterium]
MFVNQSRLPHVLPPRLYCCAEQFELEQEKIFATAWQYVAATEQLNKPGDFVTANVNGLPVIVRNFDGKLRAFLNVCPHRHSLLTNEAAGNTPQLECQYHGWQFGSDGATKRIPEAGTFKPMPGGAECLRSLQLASVGPCVMVRSADAAELPEEQWPLLKERFDEFPVQRWQHVRSWDYEFPANWKIVAENTVESYHVPTVHPKTLVRFGSEEEMEHNLAEQSSSMHSPIVSPKLYHWTTQRLLPWLELGLNNRYNIYHAFPNLFWIRIDAMLQVMQVLPLAAERSKMQVSVFVLRGRKPNLINKAISRGWGRFKVAIIKRVLAEDARLFPGLQQGARNSPFAGTISTREELVHNFQSYVARACELDELLKV